MLEAICHGLCGAIDFDRNALDSALLDAAGQGLAGEANDPERECAFLGGARFRADGQPDFVRGLCREPVKTESGEEADDAVRDSFAGLGQGVVLGETVLWTAVEASSYPGKQTPTIETSHMLSGDAMGLQVTRADDAGLLHEAEGLLSLRVFHRYVTKRRKLRISTDVL
jgi:hypothetical protein